MYITAEEFALTNQGWDTKEASDIFCKQGNKITQACNYIVGKPAIFWVPQEWFLSNYVKICVSNNLMRASLFIYRNEGETAQLEQGHEGTITTGHVLAASWKDIWKKKQQPFTQSLNRLACIGHNWIEVNWTLLNKIWSNKNMLQASGSSAEC